MDWVAGLANSLGSTPGVDVILDQLVPGFSCETQSQSQIESWMSQGINNADKVLVILTAPYARKAKDGRGGVGFEHRTLLRENGLISPRLNKYIIGTREVCTVPTLFHGRPLVDMRAPRDLTDSLQDLIALLRS